MRKAVSAQGPLGCHVFLSVWLCLCGPGVTWTVTPEPLQDGQGFATALGLTVGPQITATHLTIPSKHRDDSEVQGFLQQLVLCAKS